MSQHPDNCTCLKCMKAREILRKTLEIQEEGHRKRALANDPNSNKLQDVSLRVIKQCALKFFDKDHFKACCLECAKHGDGLFAWVGKGDTQGLQAIPIESGKKILYAMNDKGFELVDKSLFMFIGFWHQKGLVTYLSMDGRVGTWHVEKADFYLTCVEHVKLLRDFKEGYETGFMAMKSGLVKQTRTIDGKKI